MVKNNISERIHPFLDSVCSKSGISVYAVQELTHDQLYDFGSMVALEVKIYMLSVLSEFISGNIDYDTFMEKLKGFELVDGVGKEKDFVC